VTSDGGLLPLRELERRSDTMAQFAQSFEDHRNPTLIEHTLKSWCLNGYLGWRAATETSTIMISWADPAFALAVGKRDIEGQHRPRKEERGKPLAGKSTLNRLELTKRIVPDHERYRKISCDEKKVGEFFIDECVRAKGGRKVRRLILDLDCTGYTLHGDREGKHFLAYYDEYVYQPLYIFDGDMPLVVRLRRGDRASWYGVTAELSYLVPRLWERFCEVHIIVRGDSALGQEEIMAFCEENGVDLILGLRKNEP